MRKIIVSLVVALTLLVLALPAFAHQGHRSCQGFGLGTAALAQDLSPGEFGEFVSSSTPAGEVIAFLHGLECESD